MDTTLSRSNMEKFFQIEEISLTFVIGIAMINYSRNPYYYPNSGRIASAKFGNYRGSCCYHSIGLRRN